MRSGNNDSQEEFDAKDYCQDISKPVCFVVTLPILFTLLYYIPFFTDTNHTRTNSTDSNLRNLNYLSIFLGLLSLMGLGLLLRPLFPTIAKSIGLAVQSIFSRSAPVIPVSINETKASDFDMLIDTELDESSEGKRVGNETEISVLRNDSLTSVYGSVSGSRSRI